MTLILNSSIRCFLAPLLVFLGYGIMGAIQGQIVAQISAGIIGIIIFYVRFFRNLKKEAGSKLSLAGTMKTLLRYGLPLAVSAITAGFLPQFFNTLLTQSVEFVNGANYTTALGNFQAAVNFTVIITFFTVPIGTVLFPAFSKIKGKEENHILKVVFQSSVKYGALLTIPVTLMIMVLSEPIVFAVVGTEYTQAPFFLTLYSTIFLYAVLGNLSLGNFLNGQGKTEITMKLALLNLDIFELTINAPNDIEINGIFYVEELNFPIIATRQYLDLNTNRFSHCSVSKRNTGIILDNEFVAI